jgi:protein Mpv17
LFFTYMTLMDGGSFGDCATKVRALLWPTLTRHWRVWPWAQMINFSMVPPQFRVLFGNAIAFFWNAYLSYLSNSTTTMTTK